MVEVSFCGVGGDFVVGRSGLFSITSCCRFCKKLIEWENIGGGLRKASTFVGLDRKSVV